MHDTRHISPLGARSLGRDQNGPTLSRSRAMSQVLFAIVDDEEPVRNATKSLVRSLGYHASTFGSADDFLKSEQVHDTSCLITDVQMPGLSGLDLQDRLIARGHCIPIIFMTGYPDDSVRARP